MTRASLATWASAGLAFLLIGCSGNSLVSGLLGVSSGPGGDQVVFGSLETVAQNSQAKLTQFGLVVTRSDEKGTVRLNSVTRSGARFSLVLTSEQTYQGEKVHVRLEWQDRQDDEAAVQIRAHVAASGSH